MNKSACNDIGSYKYLISAIEYAKIIVTHFIDIYDMGVNRAD